MKKVAFTLAVLSVLCIILWFVNHKSIIGIDDANIYMVYMKNLANGFGFKYNISDPSVEGFTSLLWTIIGAAFHSWFGSAHVSLLIISFLFVLLTLLLVVMIDLPSGKSNNLVSYSFVVCVLLTPGFVDWTVLSLLETGLWTFLLTSTTVLLLNRKAMSSKGFYSLFVVLALLLLITRPESLLWIPVFILLNAYSEFIEGTSKISIAKQTGLLITVFVIGLAALTFWRLNTFGYPLPNTFYAKVSSDIFQNAWDGLKYLVSAFISKPFLFLILAATVYSIISNFIFLTQSRLVMLTSIFLVSLAIPLYSGGDHFGHQRFLQPTIPIAFLLVIELLKFNKVELNAKHLASGVLIVFFTSSYNIKELFVGKYSPIRKEWEIAIVERNQAEKLNVFFNTLDSLPSQGVLSAGGSAFSYHGKTIDLLGLNNIEMAHAEKENESNEIKNHDSFKKNIFYRQYPDLFFVCTGFVDPKLGLCNHISFGNINARIFKNVYFDPEFTSYYTLCRITKPGYNELLEVFLKNSFRYKLEQQGFKIEVLSYS